MKQKTNQLISLSHNLKITHKQNKVNIYLDALAIYCNFLIKTN